MKSNIAALLAGCMLLGGLARATETLHRPEEWRQVAAGVYTLRIGQPEPLTPLSLRPPRPRTETIGQIEHDAKPLPAIVHEQRGRRLVVGVPLAEAEEIFGLGVQFHSVSQRKASASHLMQSPAGRKRTIKCQSDPPADTGEAHAPAPFYVSSRGYGLLADSARYTVFHVGSSLKERIEIEIPAEGVDLYYFAGPGPLEAVRRHNLYFGGGALPPLWGLGLWYRPQQFLSAGEILKIAGEFRRRRIPCDVIGPEPGWQAHFYPCDFKWSEKFPDPKGFIGELTRQHFRLNLWEHVFVSPHAASHDELKKYSGDRLVWGGLVPDFATAQARALYQRDHEPLVELGVSGFKLDASDGSDYSVHWSFGDHALFPSGLDGEQMHNLLGPLYADTIHELFTRRNRRDYHLVRSAFAGVPALPFVLFSDYYDWQAYLRATVNSGYAGMLWSPEVRDLGPPEEIVRRLQLTLFSPLPMINAWYDGMTPWSKGGQVEAAARQYGELRMRLLPYIYSAFAQYEREGRPPVRSLALDWPADARTWYIEDQFMFGPSLMVCPVKPGAKEREVYLPAGRWHDFWSGQEHEGGKTIKIQADLMTLPLFVRDGALLPLAPVRQHAPRPGEKIELEVRHYGEPAGEFLLYDDDGETFAFQKGECGLKRLTAKRRGAQAKGKVETLKPYRPFRYTVKTWRQVN